MATLLEPTAHADYAVAQSLRARIAMTKRDCRRKLTNFLGSSSKCLSRCVPLLDAAKAQQELADEKTEGGFKLIRVRKFVIKTDADEGSYEDFGPPKLAEDSVYSTVPEACQPSTLPAVFETGLCTEPSVIDSSVNVGKRKRALRLFTVKWRRGGRRNCSRKGKEPLLSQNYSGKGKKAVTSDQILASEKRSFIQDLTDPRGEACVLLPQ
jgi:hypothetical protein